MIVYGLVTARGGSKSIPKKNIVEVCGKPLIAWTIESALRAKSIDRVICTTDSKEIADTAQAFGAEVLFMRPPELAQDDTPDFPVLEHALLWLKEHEGKVPDAIAHLRPTTPLKTKEDIDLAVDALRDNPDADSVRCVSSAPLHPIKTYAFRDKWLVPFIPESVHGIPDAHNMPRQKLPEAYASLAYLSVIRSGTILEQRSICGAKVVGVKVSSENTIDIDHPLDLEVARIAMKRRLEHGT